MANQPKGWWSHGPRVTTWLQALLLCRTTRLYGFHACGCARKCGAPNIAGRNHYWDKKGTPRLDDMMSRYERCVA